MLQKHVSELPIRLQEIEWMGKFWAKLVEIIVPPSFKGYNMLILVDFSLLI